jgi:hypothetical protein
MAFNSSSSVFLTRRLGCNNKYNNPYYIWAVTTIWFHELQLTWHHSHPSELQNYRKKIGSMRYLCGNIVAHKLIKIKIGQGRGYTNKKTYHSFVLQIIIFSYIQ